MDPFAAGKAVLFAGPRSAAAVYQAPGETAVPLRVIRSQPDRLASFGEVAFLPATNTFDIQRSDVATPVVGATITIAAEVFVITIAPVGDTEGLTSTCGAELVA